MPTDAPKPSSHVRGIDLHPGQEREDDRGEGCDERQPVLALKSKTFPRTTPSVSSIRATVTPSFDGDHARDEHDCHEHRCEFDGVQPGLLTRVAKTIR